MKKQIMSIAALAAIFTTGASAFDAERGTAALGLETSSTAFKPMIVNTTNMVTATTPIGASATQTGDALIYPAFYAQNGWSTEFSVINNKNEAVIAKVVLYSAVDSRELRDFNIYLSANDVFRATIKDGKLISTDSSTRATAQDTVSKADPAVTGYTYKDSAPMASESKPFTTDIPEKVGYIGVFAMAEADTAESDTSGSLVYAKYHAKHNNLWRDYRHMLDQCRGMGWRTTTNNYGGIFRTDNMSVPNIKLNGENQQVNPDGEAVNNIAECGTVFTTMHTPKNNGSRYKTVTFKSPGNGALSGSVLLKGDDAKGTRSLLLPATAVTNFTEDANNVGLLWTEGELANIADRCIEEGTNSARANDVQYNTECLAGDIKRFAMSSTNYEFRDAENTQLLITQPYKRVLVQVVNKENSEPTLYKGDSNEIDSKFEAYYSYYNHKIKRALDSKDVIKNITNYGEFSLPTPAIYDDNENLSQNTSDGYIVSPAPIQASTPGIPNELSVFNPLGSYNDSKSGFATIMYAANAHGIVTQMDVAEVGGTSEVNWIYPVTN